MNAFSAFSALGLPVWLALPVAPMYGYAPHARRTPVCLCAGRGTCGSPVNGVDLWHVRVRPDGFGTEDKRGDGSQRGPLIRPQLELRRVDRGVRQSRDYGGHLVGGTYSHRKRSFHTETSKWHFAMPRSMWV